MKKKYIDIHIYIIYIAIIATVSCRSVSRVHIYIYILYIIGYIL